MIENPDFEQDHCSGTAEGTYKNAHVSFRLKKWICYYDISYYENINYYDLMGSICTHLKERSKR